MKKYRLAAMCLVALVTLGLLAGCKAAPPAGSAATGSKATSASVLPTAPPVSKAMEGRIETECFAVQRLMVAGIAAYDKANPGSKVNVKGSWKAAVAKVVPKFDKHAPICPTGGVYSFKDGKPYCSIHGAAK